MADPPHVHEYRCSCGESCPHVAALREDFDDFADVFDRLDIMLSRQTLTGCGAAHKVAREAVERLRAALDGEQSARGGG